jgi:hypothetical protein
MEAGVCHLGQEAGTGRLGANLIGDDDCQLVLVSVLLQQTRHLEQPRCALCIASCRSTAASRECTFWSTPAHRCLHSYRNIIPLPCQDALLLQVGMHTLVMVVIQLCMQSQGQLAALRRRGERSLSMNYKAKYEWLCGLPA